jgi:integrase
MAKLKLSAKAVEKLRAPDPSGNQTLYWDTELRGFGVLVSGTTNGKSYVVQRDVNGRSRRVTIAATNVLSLEKARKEAEGILADFYKGIDPKSSARGRRTLGAVLEDYLTNSRLRPSSIEDYRRNVERYLSLWIDRPLSEIDAAMVIERHAAIARKVQAEGQYPGEATANGAMRTLRSLWNFAAESDTNLPANPVRALRRRWFNVPRRENYVTADQLPAFYAAVRSLDNPTVADYLVVLLFTGLRRRECAALEWDDIDLAGRTLRIPAARTKAGRKLDLPLTDLVRDLLVRRRSLGRTKYVFPANSTAGYIADPKFQLGQVAQACGVKVCAHDLRRTFITVAESCDVSVMALRALVNHTLGSGTTEGYVQMTVERLREPAQKVTDKMKVLCGITDATGANIVKLGG